MEAKMQDIVGRMEGAGCQGQSQEYGCRGTAESLGGGQKESMCNDL